MDINKPLKQDITLKMNIFARDDQNRIYKLFFHSEKDLKSKSNLFLDYSDRLSKGDIIADKVKKAVKEDLGITKIIQIKLTDSDVEDIDIDDPIVRELTEELKKQREVVLEVKYDPDLEDNFKDKLFVTWLELDHSEE